MEFKLQLLTILISLSFFLFIFNNIRKGVLDIKYSLIWLVVSVLILLSSIFPAIVFWFTELIGIETPINTLFLFGIFFLLTVTFMQNVIISKLNSRLKDMAQELGLSKHTSREKK